MSLSVAAATRVHYGSLALAFFMSSRSPVLSAAEGSTEALLHALTPTAVFIQGGEGDQNTQSYVGGLTWKPPWRYHLGLTTVSGYVEAALGKWIATERGRDRDEWLSQVGLTPVFRLRLNGSLNPWFAEAGAGANYITPIFNTGRKRFGSKFNFGDHLAIGRDFGRHELAVRIQHFSNAGIEHPNPGENFVQLRYAYRFGY